MNKLVEKLVKLLSIRGMIAISFTAVYSYLAIVGRIDSTAFEKVCLLIVAFYFGTAANRNAEQ